MTEVCSWPEGREEAIMVGVNEITAGRSIKQRKKRADIEAAKWDFNHLPRLAANWSGSCKEIANQQGKGKVLHFPCPGALVCGSWGSWASVP